MKAPRKKIPKGAAWVVLAALSTLVGLTGSSSDFLATIERKTVDLRFRLLGSQGVASRDIVLVAIDDASLKTLEPAVGRWPWPRNVHSVLLDYLGRAGARLVVFDLLLIERDFDHLEADQELAATTEETVSTVHALYLGHQQTGRVDEDVLQRSSLAFTGGFDRFTGIELPFPALAASASRLGHVTATLDADGPWRRYLLLAGYGDRLVPSLALSAALAARELPLESLEISERQVLVGEQAYPLDPDWRLPVWFNGGPGTYDSYSYGRLFYSELQIREGQQPGIAPDVFAGKIVVVGITAAGLHDLFTTPYSGSRGEGGEDLGKMNGFEIHAHVLDDLLHGRILRSAPGWQVIGLSSLAAALSLVLILYTALPWMVPFLAAPPVIYLALAQWDFAHHYALPVVPVLVTWSASVVLGLAYQYGVESSEKRQVKRIFSRYVSPDVFRQLLDNPAAADLGGSRREMTVLFSDLRGFTSFSEGRPPEEVIEQLNEYFAAMVEVVFAHRGTVDKFVGDMIMALFGAPLEDAQHADHAVRCALAMQQRLTELNRRWKEQEKPELASGIGINSGDMVAGNLGSERIQSYTVIGDNVNLGARIESLCKEFEATILVSEFTVDHLTGDYAAEGLGEVTVKGKSRPVQIFRIPVPETLGLTRAKKTSEFA